MSSSALTFSPNSSSGGLGYDDVIHIVYGDKGNIIEVQLCQDSCNDTECDTSGACLTNVANKSPVDLTGYSNLNLHVRDLATGSYVGTFHGVPIFLLTDGKIIFETNSSIFSSTGGEYEAEVEVIYNGGKTLTTNSKAKIIVRPDIDANGAAL